MRQSASRSIVARKAKPPAEVSPMTPAMGVAVRGHHTPHDHVVPRLHLVRWARWLPAVAIAIVAGAFYAIQISEPAFFHNEGRYAEVARQMVTTGDWITPRLNDTLFLNKPPLAFWLAAVSFETLGYSEAARLASIGAAMVGIVSTVRLGALLHGELIGCLAGLLLATTFGFVLEARTLRPDMLVVATVATALLCFAHVEAGDERRRRRWLVGMYAALGAGMLAKGFVPAALAGLAIAAITWQRHGAAALPRLISVPGIAAFAAVALPWHVAVALRHPGFAWDYIVNQHVLFFMARKLPRDSVGEPLLEFWATFLLRSMPWILLVPLAGAARGLAWTWLVTVMAFFSATPARLEQYSLPALPAVALLAACGIERLWTGRAGPHAWRWLAVVTVLVMIGGVSALGRADRMIESAYWLDRASPLTALVRPVGVGLTGLGVVLAATAWRRHAPAFVTAPRRGERRDDPHHRPRARPRGAALLVEAGRAGDRRALAGGHRGHVRGEGGVPARGRPRVLSGAARHLARVAGLRSADLSRVALPLHVPAARAFPRAVARRRADGRGQRSRGASRHVRRHRPGAVSRRRAVRRPVAAVECRAVGVRRTAAGCGSDRRRCVINRWPTGRGLAREAKPMD